MFNTHRIDLLKPISDGTKGQGLTEFLLIIPLFFVLLLGVIQFSLLYFAFNIAHYASFAACRAAIVRPCSLFNPDHSSDPSFTPAVFSAAVLATMAAVPSYQMFLDDVPYPWMPTLPLTSQVQGLDFMGGAGEIAMIKYINATYLTSVQRVQIASDPTTRPVAWEPCTSDSPCASLGCDAISEPQFVPPPGDDISVEVTFLYPLIVPVVNRVVYGIFVNFTEISEKLLLEKISPEEEVIPLPAHTLAQISNPVAHLRWTVSQIFKTFGFANGSKIRLNKLVDELAAKAWYIIPVRARCTLTVEGSTQRLMGGP